MAAASTSPSAASALPQQRQRRTGGGSLAMMRKSEGRRLHGWPKTHRSGVSQPIQLSRSRATLLIQNQKEFKMNGNEGCSLASLRPLNSQSVSRPNRHTVAIFHQLVLRSDSSATPAPLARTSAGRQTRWAINDVVKTVTPPPFAMKRVAASR